LITTSSGEQKLIPVKFVGTETTRGGTNYLYDSNRNDIEDLTLNEDLDHAAGFFEGDTSVWFDYYNS
jgi:hypothetical protein